MPCGGGKTTLRACHALERPVFLVEGGVTRPSRVDCRSLMLRFSTSWGIEGPPIRAAVKWVERLHGVALGRLVD